MFSVAGFIIATSSEVVVGVVAAAEVQLERHYSSSEAEAEKE